jgi:flagellar biosynthetic protein FlhB
VVAIAALGKGFLSSLEQVFVNNFALRREEITDTATMAAHLVQALYAAFVMLLPFLGITLLVAVLSSIALGGFNFSAEALAPKLGKLNPLSGLKRVVSARGLMELVKSLAKFALIGGLLMLILWWSAPDLLRLNTKEIDVAVAESGRLLAWASALLASVFVLIALVDVPFQLWDHKRRLKMTQQEVREELKETEGKPEVRSRIRQLQREAAQRRMMDEVAKADVIVTNPTHFAVALRYDPDLMAAPVVVGKGVDLVAANIRQVGTANDVPVVEAPLLSRAIYFNTELSEPIPVGLYLAVAQLLAYVFQLRVFAEAGGDVPQPPEEYPIPEDYRAQGSESEAPG